MAEPASDLDRAFETIRGAHLAHPDGQLLECFLEDSIDPEQAAHYMLQRCFTGRDGPDLALLLSDWKQLIAAFAYDGSSLPPPDKRVVANITRRDGNKCCLTGLGGSLWDPLVVTPILPITKIQINESLHDILGAFVGPTQRDCILSNAASLNVYQNHWLVRRSAAVAMSQGFFRFKFSKGSEHRVLVVRIGGPLWPSIIDLTPLLRHTHFADHSPSNIDTPDVSALQILSRFAKPIRWNLVGRDISSRKTQPVTDFPSSSSRRFFLGHVATFLATMWRLVPTSLRVRAYRGLAFLGAQIYGPSCSRKVQQLPFGLYLKTERVERRQGLANEYSSLQLVRRYTHIPTPRPLDLILTPEKSYLLTSKVPGLRLGMCIDALSDGEMKTLLHDLQKCIGELREISKEVAPNHAITNALGEACYDYRISAGLDYDEGRGDFVGPFVNEDKFNEILRCGALPDVTHRSGHEIVFTHGDLNMRNVLMHNGRLSGIVDWENSGWYPEYWDYTKARYITKLQQRWLRTVDEVFKQYGNYENELETEYQLWHYCF